MLNLTLAAILSCLMLMGLAACQSIDAADTKDDSLFLALGGVQGIEAIVDTFIYEISESETVIHHFEDTNLNRFRAKQIEHICVLAGGPCRYTGDEMIEVHQGMNITEAGFNTMTNTLIRALDQHGISVGDRNRLLAIIAPMRGEVIYR